MKAKKAAKRKQYIRSQLALGKVNRGDGAWVDISYCDRKVADRAQVVAKRMADGKGS